MESGLGVGLAGFEELELGESFFLEDLGEEIATEAGYGPCGFVGVEFDATEGAGYRPANAATASAAVDAVGYVVEGGGTGSLGVHSVAARLAAALDDLPAVDPSWAGHGPGLGEQGHGVSWFLDRIEPLLVGAVGDPQGLSHPFLGVSDRLADHLQFADHGVGVVGVEFSLGWHDDGFRCERWR